MQPGPESAGLDLRESVAAGLLEDHHRFLHLPVDSRLNNRPGAVPIRGMPAAFLDRDGVVLDESAYLLHAKDLTMMPGAIDAITALSEFYLVVIITNQSAVARGMLDQDGLANVHSQMVQNVVASGGIVDAIYYCPHLPDGGVDSFSIVCECRKPAPGMILSAVTDWEIDVTSSFLVGDQERDILAGDAASVVTYRGRPAGDFSDLLAVSSHVLRGAEGSKAQ